MKKLFAALATAVSLCAPLPALSEPDVKYNSYDAMGCMKVGDCTQDVHQLRSYDHLVTELKSDFSPYETEIRIILDSLNEVGVKVYLAEGRYFPKGHRGSYYTDVNKFFLNRDYVWDPFVFMQVFRHEGWHAAQDCMAGDIKNTFIAVIFNEELIPNEFKVSAQVRYGLLMEKAIPWEQEAIWAGWTEGMTADALNACANGPMWDEYSPTPMTREWLTDKGYIQ